MSFRSSAILALVCSLSAVAEPGVKPGEEPEDDLDSEDVVALAMQPWSGDLDEILQRGYIRALVPFSRTSYFIDRGRQRGLAYEGLKEFEKTLNGGAARQVPRVRVLFIPVRRDELLTALAEGRGEVAVGNLTITPERMKLVDFSEPIMSGVSEVLVTGAGAGAVGAAEDLSGREVVVRRTSSYDDSLRKLNAKLVAAGKPPVQIVAADENLEDEDLLEMVNAGLIPATVVDNHIADFWRKVFPGIRVQPSVILRSGGSVAWAIRKGSPKLTAAINSFVRDHRRGTTFGNILFNRYLKDTQFVQTSVSKDEIERFNRTAALIEKYASQYDFDWLLVAAQGYQESHLDQSKRSAAGAVGVMQIKPATAAGPPIEIDGVDQVENNIHAGVKYLRYIRDRYFDDPAIAPLDRQLFTFAAYNAGPARIAALRKKAAAMKLDPNRWFKNVEVVAARDIGRETVDYVGNILKYYVAYSRIIRQNQEKQAAKRSLAKDAGSVPPAADPKPTPAERGQRQAGSRG